MTMVCRAGVEMVWACTNWEVDWTAIAAVSTAFAGIVALCLGLANLFTGYLRRRAQARVIGLLIGPEMGRVSGHLHRIFVGWSSHKVDLEGWGFDSSILMNSVTRGDLLTLLPDLEHPLLGQQIDRLYVLPRPCVQAILDYLDSMECFKKQLQLVGSHQENNSEFVKGGFAQCRDFLDRLIVLNWMVTALCQADSTSAWYSLRLPNVDPPTALEIVQEAYKRKGQSMD